MMISTAAKILAIAIPLGLCLVVFLSIAVVLRRRLVHQRRHHDNATEKLHAKLKEQQVKLDEFTTAFDGHSLDSGTLYCDLYNSFTGVYHSFMNTNWDQPLAAYVEKWLINERQPPIDDEVSRLDDVFFREAHAQDTIPSNGRVFSTFPNPHQYTSAEIAEYLQDGHLRPIAHHIIVSVLLHNTSIRGCPYKSILPFNHPEINGLYNLMLAVRNGLQLYSRISAHICRFGNYKAKMTPAAFANRELHHTFFETLFQPYFKSNSPKDLAERRADLDKLLDAAVSHGLLVLSSLPEIDYEWGEREDRKIAIAPALVSTSFSDIEHKPCSSVPICRYMV